MHLSKSSPISSIANSRIARLSISSGPFETHPTVSTVCTQVTKTHVGSAYITAGKPLPLYRVCPNRHEAQRRVDGGDREGQERRRRSEGRRPQEEAGLPVGEGRPPVPCGPYRPLPQARPLRPACRHWRPCLPRCRPRVPRRRGKSISPPFFLLLGFFWSALIDDVRLWR